MMIVLDSNVISGLMRQPEAELILWLDAQPLASLWTTSACIYEIEYGLHCLPSGRRRDGLRTEFRRAIEHDLNGRVLDFDSDAAAHSAAISAQLRKIGRPIDVRDAMIAGIARSRQATLTTRNTKHFAQTGLQLVNPWRPPTK